MTDPITITVSVLSLILLGVGLVLQHNCSTRQAEHFRLMSERSVRPECPNCEGSRAEGETV